VRPPELCFSNETKKLAKERAGYRCQICGKEGNLEIHHRVAIWFAQEIPCLSYVVLSSLCNAIAICTDCHKKLHDPTKESRTQYAEEAQGVLHDFLEENLHPEKDNWRTELKKHANGNYYRPRSRNGRR